MLETIKNYIKLTKPGVLFGNVFTSVAGFLFASTQGFTVQTFLAMLAGTTLIIASACCINNYLDQDIDAKMQRTKTRPLIAKKVSPLGALIFGIVLGLAGLAILLRYNHILVAMLGVIGFVTYVWLYGAFTKRRSVHGTLVGSISGAIPVMAGYVAAAHTIDMNAVLLFLILFSWQEPEFYSIAIYRRKEYKAAGVPIISVVRGVTQTKQAIFIYTMLFVMYTLLLAIVGTAGYVYFAVMALLGAYWLRLAWQGLAEKNSDAWARKMFHASIKILMIFCVVLALNPWLP